MIRERSLILTLLLLTMISSSASAQYSVSYGAFSNGSATTGGLYTIYSTAGQTAVGLSTKDDYQVQSGFWHIAEYGTPLDVAITSFIGFYSEKAIVLSWRVKSDLPLEGFNVYRSSGGDEQFVRLNEQLLDAGTIEYVDKTVLPGESYVYRFGLVDAVREYVSTDVFIDTPYMPLALEQNFPNPFNPATTIKYYLPSEMHVRLEIFDISGKRIRSLVNREQAKGYYTEIWDGTGDGGNSVASGIYFYLIRAGKETMSRKMVLLR